MGACWVQGKQARTNETRSRFGYVKAALLPNVPRTFREEKGPEQGVPGRNVKGVYALEPIPTRSCFTDVKLLF